MKLFNILGSKCVRCGFTDVRALQFDHVYGSGMGYLRAVGNRHRMFKYFADNPQMARIFLQVLCANCNWIKRVEKKEYRSFDPKKEEERRKIEERNRFLEELDRSCEPFWRQLREEKNNA